MAERFRTTANIWNWLPAFRAVAETEHLPSASKMMNVTAPALSQTVKQLEEYLGYELFHRRGRRLELNDRGRRLLVSVRNSMRLVDDALAINEEEHFIGPLRWTSSWSLSSIVVEAMSRLVDEHPGLLPLMFQIDDESVPKLLRGDLDLVVATGSVEVEGLASTVVGELPHRVYCGRHHRFFGREDVEFDDLEGERFAAPLRDETGNYFDGWPAERPREVVMEFAQMAVGYRACREQALLAVLPAHVAGTDDGLWALQDIPASHHAFAIHRTTLDEIGPVEAVVEHIVETLAALPTSG